MTIEAVAAEAAVKAHFDAMHAAGLSIPYERISERSKRIVANQQAHIVRAIVAALAPMVEGPPPPAACGPVDCCCCSEGTARRAPGTTTGRNGARGEGGVVKHEIVYDENGLSLNDGWTLDEYLAADRFTTTERATIRESVLSWLLEYDGAACDISEPIAELERLS